MEYTSLGRTGMMVSRLCLGAMMFGQRTTESDSHQIIDYAIGQGVNFIDTSNTYGEWGEGKGRSEEILGSALAKNGKRDEIILATKFRWVVGDRPNDSGVSRHHILQQVEKSLRRLQTDYIDLYQIHAPVRAVPIDETLRALDDLVRSGKVRYIGTSNFSAWMVIEGLWTSDRLHLNRFISEQPPYSMANRAIERELVPMAQAHDIAILPWSPLWGGLLTGKYRRDRPVPPDSRLTFSPLQGIWDSRLQDRFYDLIDLLDELAASKGCTIPQLVLAWTIAQPAITSAIIGPRTLEQAQDNIGAVSVQITAEDMARIDAISPPGSILAPLPGQA
jgi:aryl-alcohol dehydrogenase-like predicted oxidoreductase